MLHILPNKNAQVATIVIRIGTFVRIAIIAFVGIDRCGIRDPILHAINIRCSGITWPKENGNDTNLRKTGNIVENIFCAVILGIAT